MNGLSTSPRILACAYNRRRNRVSPHFETDGTIIMNVRTTKPKLSSIKPPRGDISKLSSLRSSENIQDWSEKRCCDDSSKASTDTCDEHLRDDDERPSVFRESADYDDQEGMMVLKRANPVYDSDDEDYLEAPAKRQRISSTETVLLWSARLSENPSVFSIQFQH